MYKYTRIFKSVLIVGAVITVLQWMPNAGGHGGAS